MFRSIHGKAFGFDSIAPLLYVHGVAIGPSQYPVRGRRLFVDSNNGAAGVAGESPRNALSTLQAAIDRVNGYAAEDNVGTEIVVMPKHAETITGASGLAVAGPPGLTITGLGNYNQRPRFLMDGGTTVDFAVSAADVTLRNLVFASGNADVVRCFNVTAKGAWFDGIEFVNNVVDENFLTPIKATSTSDNNADGLKVTNCRVMTVDAATLEMIEINANLDALVAANNFMVCAGTASPMFLCAAGKLLTNAHIHHCYLKNAMTANELFFSNDGSTNTGIAHDIYVQHLDTTTTHDVGLESSGLALFNIWSSSTIALQGGVIPAADVNL